MAGATILTKRSPERTALLRDRIAMLARRMGWAEPELVEDEHYLYFLHPLPGPAGNLSTRRSPAGDFVHVCGTLTWRRSLGAEAAEAMLRTNCGVDGNLEEAHGHFALLLRKDGVARLLTDPFGGFHIYLTPGAEVVTTSFLIAAACLDQATLSTQGVYEYAFNGVVSGNDTLLREVTLLPWRTVLDFTPDGPRQRSLPWAAPLQPCPADRRHAVERTLEILDAYFADMAAIFGDNITSALSGGYDSRLILGMLRRHGVSPSLYVYGAEDDADVVIAREIARNEHVGLTVLDKDRHRTVEPDAFAETVERNLLDNDGYGWSGILGNGVEEEERRRRQQGGRLAVNGGGGEILRNFFYLPGTKGYSARQLVWTFYSRFDPAVCTGRFRARDFVDRMTDKVTAAAGLSDKRLPRPTVDWLYHRFRCRAWDGRVNSINARYGWTALPFLNPALTEHACRLPLDIRNHGILEAELIRRIDPHLAAYPSNYGHSFADPPPLGRVLKDWTTYVRPPTLRRFNYRLRHRMMRPCGPAAGLSAEHMRRVLPHGTGLMDGFFKLDRVRDREVLQRILSLEIAAPRFNANLRLEH